MTSFSLAPDETWYLSVCKLFVRFDDRIELETGTGFFVLNKDVYYLVTARHVVDPRYRLINERRDAKIIEVELVFTGIVSEDEKFRNSAKVSCDFKVESIFFDPDENDLAVIPVPKSELPIIDESVAVRPCSFALSFLATKDDLNQRSAGDSVCFIGYPKGAPDFEFYSNGELNTYTMPMWRAGYLANSASFSVGVEGFLGKNYGIIDGFAQSGFSGGPVVSLQKGFPDGFFSDNRGHLPARLIGVICGHYLDADYRADGAHSGYSYYVRSDSILKIFEENNLLDWPE